MSSHWNLTQNMHPLLSLSKEVGFVGNDKEKLLNPPKVSKWDNKGADLFRSLLNQEASPYHINTLWSKLKDNSLTSNIQGTTKLFVKFLNGWAVKTLKLKQKHKTKKKLA